MTDEQRSQAGCIGVQESVVILARALRGRTSRRYPETVVLEYGACAYCMKTKSVNPLAANIS